MLLYLATRCKEVKFSCVSQDFSKIKYFHNKYGYYNHFENNHFRYYYESLSRKYSEKTRDSRFGVRINHIMCYIQSLGVSCANASTIDLDLLLRDVIAELYLISASRSNELIANPGHGIYLNDIKHKDFITQTIKRNGIYKPIKNYDLAYFKIKVRDHKTKNKAGIKYIIVGNSYDMWFNPYYKLKIYLQRRRLIQSSSRRVFLFKDGSHFTLDNLKATIKSIARINRIDLSYWKIGTHSFRIGMNNILISRRIPIAFIKAIGFWADDSNPCWQLYVRPTLIELVSIPFWILNTSPRLFNYTISNKYDNKFDD